MSGKKDLKLDPITHDLVFENHDLSFVSETDRVAQIIKIRLWTFLGEWFLDTTAGLPWYQSILVKNPKLQTIDALIRKEILSVEDVLEIVEFNMDYNPSLRTVTIDFSVSTNYGNVSTGVTL